MRFTLLIILLLFNPTFLSANQNSNDSKLSYEAISNSPIWDRLKAPPEPIVETPPIYLDIDSKKNVYRVDVEQDKAGNYNFSDVLVSQQTLKEIRSHQPVILQNMANIDLPGERGTSALSSSCPLPTSFQIAALGDGIALGSAKVANTNRPAEATTQW